MKKEEKKTLLRMLKQKKSVSETEHCTSSPLSLNTSAGTRGKMFPTSNLVFPSTFYLIASTETTGKRVRNVTLYFRERFGLTEI